MNHWSYKSTHKHTLVLNTRISLTVVQTRGDGPNSPWWATLTGVGSDPETGKPPTCAFDENLNDEQVKAAAVKWARPKLSDFVGEQSRAIEALLYSHAPNAQAARYRLTGQPIDELLADEDGDR